MRRTEKLDELAGILEGLRQLPELDEVNPGVFYVKRRAFLHFHESTTARHADVRNGKRIRESRRKVRCSFVHDRAQTRHDEYVWLVNLSPSLA